MTSTGPRPGFRPWACCLLSLGLALALPASADSVTQAAIAAGDPRSPGGRDLTHDPAHRGPEGLLHAPHADPRGARLLGADFSRAGPHGSPMAGPVFDAVRCATCHLEAEPEAHARRGPAPLVLRPAYGSDRERLGNQLRTRAEAGAQPDATLELTWTETHFTYPDGERRTLRRPLAQAVTPSGESLPVALRIAPLLWGWGLIEAVPQETIALFHDPLDRDGDGISGKLASGAMPRGGVGIFGWKGEHEDLVSQVAAALDNDMGVTTAASCATRGCEPELDTEALDRLVAFLAETSVPDRRPATRDRAGARLFGETGCPACHVSALRTGEGGKDRFAGQIIWAYTDLLLHDMGEGLADPGDAPDRREWRTAPLWGLGLAEQALPERGFLHDGRARDLEEAILWHGGEGAAARDRFVSLSREDRRLLLAYLRSL